MIAAVVLVAVCGVLLGCALGLYVGERGRRIDAQLAANAIRRETLYTPTKPRARVVDASGRPVALGGAPADPAFEATAVEAMVRDIMEERGCSRETALEEAQRWIADVARIGIEGG